MSYLDPAQGRRGDASGGGAARRRGVDLSGWLRVRLRACGLVRHIAAALAVALVQFAPAHAADARCGGVAAACDVPGGSYYVLLPDGPGPHPALLFLHGHGGSGDIALRNRARLGPFVDAGWAVIAPDGARWRTDGPRSWNAMLNPAGRDDVAFLHAVADDAAARFGLLRAAMTATGFSAGGMMVWRLACDTPEAFAAYAPVAGTLWAPLPDHCAGPAPMFHMHGTTDKVVPMEGRSMMDGRLVQGNLIDALGMLRRTMGCVGAATAPREPEGWRAEAWTACTGRGAITLVTHGGGHSVPPGWANAALAFFAAHPRG